MRLLLPAIATLVMLGHGESFAQTATPPAQPQSVGRTVAFEAASVKANKSGVATSAVGRQPGGRFSAQNATLLEILGFAYQIQPYQLVGVPAWASSDRWDIVAKLEALPSPVPSGVPDDTLLALRTLLLDRFKLMVHRETRELPIYALVLARSDGRLGPKMKASAVDCVALMAARRGGAPSPGGTPCAMQGRVGSVQSSGAPLSEFTDLLSRRVQRTVVDRTGLTGGWDFVLTYTPEPSQIAAGTLAPGIQPPAADPNAPSLFTALQEQLGLKLDSTRGAIEALVIDRVERPSED